MGSMPGPVSLIPIIFIFKRVAHLSCPWVPAPNSHFQLTKLSDSQPDQWLLKVTWTLVPRWRKRLSSWSGGKCICDGLGNWSSIGIWNILLQEPLYQKAMRRCGRVVGGPAAVCVGDLSFGRFWRHECWALLAEGQWVRKWITEFLIDCILCYANCFGWVINKNCILEEHWANGFNPHLPMLLYLWILPCVQKVFWHY